ncbi:hypothetical protein LCGC14_2482580, partial [marine sediment metagenome]
MNTIFVKEQGEYIRKDFTSTELVDWFRDNITESGDVQEDIKLYGTADIKLEGESF